MKKYKELKNGLTLSKIKKKFPWLIKAKFENAVISINKYNNLTWEDGTWMDGIWKGGIWEDGTWKDGTWGWGTWMGGI